MRCTHEDLIGTEELAIFGREGLTTRVQGVPRSSAASCRAIDPTLDATHRCGRVAAARNGLLSGPCLFPAAGEEDSV